jgi:hypothetical protein
MKFSMGEESRVSELRNRVNPNRLGGGQMKITTPILRRNDPEGGIETPKRVQKD